ASASDVRTHLTPATIIAYESEYEPTGSTTVDERTVITGAPAGRLFAPRWVFESTDGGYRYWRDDGRPSAVNIETTVEIESHERTTEVRFRSTVTASLPVPLLERLVAWRRRRLLSRMCHRLTNALR
ncbi:MAG: hypothetical protein R3324_13500, partial [Halobacteriales archaeon]|nr:hypothetical protein [Halobacteriales archaeon]